MDIVLIPGLWLDGSSWRNVVPLLEGAGHRVFPITLPGMESIDADRSEVTLSDCVDAVVEVVDAADGKVLIVGHSAGCGIAHAVVDARPAGVKRGVYVGGFPTGDGIALADYFTPTNGEIPFPGWSVFEDEDVRDLDESLRAEFERRAIPSPARMASDLQHLSDDSRYDVPVTVVCTEFTSDMLRGWVDAGMEPVSELAHIEDVSYVDLPTGHWPQFTRPVELAGILLAVAEPTN